ncbi:hypothetical protein CJ030_MR2G020028 [Morella rubra]|uniref:Uncharacterized protein n=1 Tax=Morella rubra TaxID=262757 RepID=A0A6A1WGJ1_9ROSI|nr:hypothetical protein CJ030_MR2G020028 [Morella rubra]
MEEIEQCGNENPDYFSVIVIKNFVKKHLGYLNVSRLAWKFDDRARTTRTGTGSSSQEQEVADPMMTLERRMEYLRGRPVAKERLVTLSDFDQLLAATAVEEASRPTFRGTYGDGAPAVPPPWVAQLFADLDSRVSATVKATLQPVERQMQSLEEQLKELRTAFDGECTVTMLRNKSVVAHMADVNEQLEEIKKTLDDFKTEADPQRIPGDIPDDVATFRDAVRR